jgi:hypothetical protein
MESTGKTASWVLVGLATALATMTATERMAAADDWHVGLNMRTDLGTRQVRLDGGVRTGRLDWIMVLDPMGVADSQYDFDLLAAYRFASLPGWAVLAGHRTTVFDLEYGRGFHEKVLVGAAGGLPNLFSTDWLRGEWGVEMAVDWYRHGTGLPDEFISFKSGRHFGDLVNFSFFARFEYKSVL